VASTAVLLTFALLPSLRLNKNLRLIAYLTFGNLILSLALAGDIIFDWNFDQGTIETKVQIFFHIYGECTVTVWGIIFGVQLHCIITNRTQTDEKFLLLIGYVFPLLPSITFSLLPMNDKTLSEAQSIIAIILLMYLLFVYRRIVIGAKQMLNQESAKRLIQQIMYYPAVLGVNLIFLAVTSVIEMESGCTTVVSGVLSGLWYFQGLIDAILYGNNTIVREEIKAYWRKRNLTQSHESSLNEFALSKDDTYM